MTIVAFPGVPEPPLDEEEEAVLLLLLLLLLLPLLLLEELAVGVTDGAGVAGDGPGGPGGPVPCLCSCLHCGAGTESAVTAKRPMVTMAVMGDLEKRILGLSFGFGSGKMDTGDEKKKRCRSFNVKLNAKRVQKVRAEE